MANRRGVSRTLILFCVAWNLGMMGGQLAAGSLFSRGMNWTYGTALFVCVLNLGLALVAALRVVPLSLTPGEETPEQLQGVELAGAYKRLSWIANLGGMFGGSMVIHLLPGLAVAIGIPPDDHGKLLAIWRAIIIATYLVMHVSSFWHYRLSASLTSQVLAAAGLIGIAGADSAFTLLVGLALLGQLVGYNYFSGLFYSAAGSTHERRTLAAGIHEATLAAGMSLGTIVGGALGSLVNERVPYVLAAAVLLAIIVVQSIAWWVWVRPRPA